MRSTLGAKCSSEPASPEVASASYLDVAAPESPDAAVHALFEAELSLVKLIALQVARSLGNLAEFDELMALGREGLFDAARRFDPARGVPFRAYANYRVRGTMIDGVRKMAALPRRAYERLAALEAANLASEGQAELAFSPAFATESPANAEDALDSHIATMVAASAMSLVAGALRAQAEARAGEAVLDPEAAYALSQLVTLIQGELANLPSDEAAVIQGYYFEGRGLDEVGQSMKLSKSWASRLHTRALARLSKRLRHVPPPQAQLANPA